jgi:predicted PhzF superfamily epimerase YddE/YHI9
VGNEAADLIEAFQIHAFSRNVHGGNPAGVCILQAWLQDDALRNVAQDLGPSVTAFVLKSEDRTYPLRWFTRGGEEVDSFCGHATFSAAHVLLRLKGLGNGELDFHTTSGIRHVARSGDRLTMTVPYWEVEEIACPKVVLRSIGARPVSCYRGPRDLMLVFNSPAEVLGLQPDYSIMRELGNVGLIATAPRSDAEIVHRFFCPGFSIAENEDHATGSALSSLGPYWTRRLGIPVFSAFQASARGGFFECNVQDRVVTIAAHCATFLVGSLQPPNPATSGKTD